MAQRDQLEVVSPNGDLLFFELDESDGVTNIGRHPSNDVVLPGQEIGDFHLMIDHRSRPYQVSVIDPNATAMLDGQRLEPGHYYPLHDWAALDVAGYSLILVEGENGYHETPPPVAAPVVPPGPAPSTTPSTGPSTMGSQRPLPSVATEATAAAAVAAPVPPTDANGGPSTAPAAQSPAVQPAPGQSATVQPPAPSVAPRPPASQEAAPPAVPSPSLPAESAPSDPAVRAGLDGDGPVRGPDQGFEDLDDENIVLTISEREQVVDVEQAAVWNLTVANGGSLVARFDVHIVGWIDASWITIQPAALNLYEGGRGNVTLTITPPRLPTSLAGAHRLAVVVTSPNYPNLRAQRAITLTINPFYDFNVGEVSPRRQTVNYFRKTGFLRLPVQNRGNSATPFRVEATDDENQITFELESPHEDTRLVRQIEVTLEPDQTWTVPIHATPRTHRIVGVGTHTHSLTLTTSMPASQQSSRAVLAELRNRPIVGPWVITALLFLIAAIVVLSFQPRVQEFDFAPGVVDTTELDGETTGGAGDLAAAAAGLQGARIFGVKLPKLPKLPKQLAFLNNFWPGGGAEDGATVALAPVSGAMVDAGNEVILTWQTSRAGSLTLEKLVGGDRQFIATIDNPSQQRQYAFVADTRERATYVLTAHNWIERLPYVGATFGRDEAQLGLIVDPVRPLIEVFDVGPQTLVTGQPLNITWQVARATGYELLVNGVPRPLTEARGSIQEAPSTSTEYRLVARSPYWDEAVMSPPIMAVVSLPTPMVRNFAVEPQPIVEGDPVRVAWEVEGAEVVSIDPLPGPVPNLQGVSEGILEAGRTQQMFTLLATIGEGPERVEALATRLLDVVPPSPTPTETPLPTATPSATPTPIPTPLVKLFDIEPKPVVDGENVRVIWAVEGASSVEISPILGVVPNLEGQNEILIDPGKSQETFTLRAVMDDDIEQVEARATRVVAVVTSTPTVTPTPTPTPTQTPQLPVIQVFELVPNEVVRGDVSASAAPGENAEAANGQSRQPTLTWTVVGEATNIQITGPDFGPVQNLPKEGSLRVPVNETTVYQLNVYHNDELISSLTQELTVLEPTPTPVPPTPVPPPPTETPTPTPTPTPNIVAFTVNAVNTGAVVPVSSDDDIPTYEVNAGTLIRLAWRIENPVTEVRLTDSQNDYGTRSPEDEFQVVVTRSTIFQLAATGAPGWRIRINVNPIQPPARVFNVSGSDGETLDDPATVMWDYPGEDQARIMGFKIYRANIDNFNFAPVADAFALDSTARSWSDTATPSCDHVYYVVAVYIDITRTGEDRIQETAASESSWYTRQCP